MSREQTPKNEAELRHAARNALAAGASGTVSAAVFNPWDRALFLSVEHHRPVFDPRNFKHPWQGVIQAVVQRSVFSGGLYFFLQAEAKKHFAPRLRQAGLNETGTQFGMGWAIGMTTAVLSNPVAAVKYKMWIRHEARCVPTAKDMYRQGGAAVFARGIQACAVRDIIFAGTYEAGRQRLRGATDAQTQRAQFTCDLTAAAIAAAVSAPANYVKNRQYAADSTRPAPTTSEVFYKLAMQAARAEENPVRHVARQLRLFAGPTRVGVGMAVGQALFDKAKTILHCQK